MLHCLEQLFKLSEISVKHLQETGIGRTVNNLRKHDDLEVGIASKALVTKWKTLVAEDSEDDVSTEKLTNYNNKNSDNEDDNEKKLKFLTSSSSNSTSELHSSNTNGNNSLPSKSDKKTSPKTSHKHSSKHHKHSSSDNKVEEKIDNKSYHKRKLEHSENSSGTKKIRSDPLIDDVKPPILEDFKTNKEILNKDSDSAKEKSKRSHREEDKKKSSDERKHKSSSDEKDSKHRKASSADEKASKHHKPSSADEKDSKYHKSLSAKDDKPNAKDKDKKQKRKNVPDEDGNEFDGNNGIGFAEALAMFDDFPKRSKKSIDVPVITHKLTSSSGSSSSKQSSSDKVKNESSSTSAKVVKEEKKPLKNIESLKATPKLLAQVPSSIPPLPDIFPEPVPISNDYRPNPMSSLMMDCLFSSSLKPMKKMSDEDLLAASFSSKASRTKVYSGLSCFFYITNFRNGS